MYNNQPPFRPPPGNIPPFPPNFNPGQNGNFPPFPPPQGFVPPPFPPNFSPGGGPPGGVGTPPSYLGNSSPGVGFRPPLGAIPPRPGHPGLGLPPLPAGLPQPPHLGGPGSGSAGVSGTPPAFVKEVKTTSVFVGSIAPGITDDTLRDLLNACGPLHELKRVSGASGKPQAFGFALYENPEVVMRCIRCLNGVELPDMSPEGRSEGRKKALVVKVDEKTREFLEEFEQTLGRSDDDEEADAICRKSISHLVALITDPNAIAPAGIPNPGGRSPINVVVPAHLQDLKEGDLPENQRVAVLDQIAIFRENAARRERDKKKIDDEKDRAKALEAARNPNQSPSTAGYGYGTRAFNQVPQRKWGESQNQNQNQNQSSPRQQNGGSSARRPNDPQGYDKPVNFVRPTQAEGKDESERTDEEEEELRRQRRDRERDHALRDRERRVEHRERQRLDNLNRELAQRRSQAEFEERNRKRQTELYETWDDDEKIEKGREWFYSDRARWRAQRQQARTREYQDDLRDRHKEEEERRALEIESEEFLKRQMAELAELEEQQRKRGLLTEDAAPIKLSINAPIVTEPKEEKKPDVAPVKPKVAFGEDDDDDENDPNKKKKRTFVKLEYSGEGDDGMTEAEKIARRNAKLLEIKRDVPRDRNRLWSTRIEWAAVGESAIRGKFRPFVHEKMKDLLGEVDEDLADFVLEHIRDRKGPHDLIEGLEPVFAEEATTFVVGLWRQLAFETAAFAAGLETGNMMV